MNWSDLTLGQGQMWAAKLESFYSLLIIGPIGLQCQPIYR